MPPTLTKDPKDLVDFPMPPVAPEIPAPKITAPKEPRHRKKRATSYIDHAKSTKDNIVPKISPTSTLESKPKKRKNKGRSKKSRRKINAFYSLTTTLELVDTNKNVIFRYIEAFLNTRPQTKENIALGIFYHIYKDLSPEERAKITYEDLLDKVTERTSGRYTLDPAYVISAVSGGAHTYNIQIAHTIAAVNVPEVVLATIREATKLEGSSHLDRKLLLELTGVADKENKSIIINNNNNLTNNSVTVESGIPKFMGEIVNKDSRLREVYRQALKDNNEAKIREDRLLTPGNNESEIIEGELA